jgi:hypothetical protein
MNDGETVLGHLSTIESNGLKGWLKSSLMSMAGKLTNAAVQALRQQQKAEETALMAVLGAGGAVEQARQRRAVELVALDAAVSEAVAGEDVALAVLGALMAADRAGRLAGVSPARMQQALRRAAGETVAGRLEGLTGAPVAVRRRGRPRGSGMPRRRKVPDAGSTADDQRHDEQQGSDESEHDADDGEGAAAAHDEAV